MATELDSATNGKRRAKAATPRRRASDIAEVAAEAGTRRRQVDPAKRLRHAEILLNVSKKVAAIEALDELLEMIVRHRVGGDRLPSAARCSSTTRQTGELYSRVAQGNVQPRDPAAQRPRASPAMCSRHGEGVIIRDAYADKRFDAQRRRPDRLSHAQHPLRADPHDEGRPDRRRAGAEQAGSVGFDQADLALLEDDDHAGGAWSLQSTRCSSSRMQKAREQEMEFLDIVSPT
jgi:adenylate cyclase